MKYKILLIEPDDKTAGEIKKELVLNDFYVVIQKSAESSLEEIKFSQPDFLLIDIDLPDMDGFRLCRSIKQNTKSVNVPIVLFSNNDKSRVEDIITGLECGADDFLRAPISLKELTARIKAIIRRMEYKGDIDEIINVGILQLNISEHTVMVKTRRLERRVQFTPKEFDLLHILMRKAGKAVSRETILEVVWGYSSEVDTKTLDVYIHRLREKLGSEAGKYIETIPGLGYKCRPDNK
jgi:two-component system alkaline phosphatase synthesis response regulator PhoP